MECPRCRIGQRDSRTLLRAVRNIEHLIEADLVFADHVDGLHHEIEAALRACKSCASDVAVIFLNLALILSC